MPTEVQTRQLPWEDLGHRFSEKCYSTREALNLSGLNWTVETVPLFAEVDGNRQTVPRRFGVLRKDTNVILDVVSDLYCVLQNEEAFAFFEPFLHEKELFLHSALELQGGRKVCLIAQLADNIREIIPNDTVRSYLIFATSHDGSLKTSIKFTNIRPSCMNTLKTALLGEGAGKSVRHSKNQHQRLADVQTSLNIYKANFEQEVNLYKEMAARRMDVEDTRRYLENLFSKELTAAAKRAGVPTSEFALEDYRATKKILHNFMFSEDLQMPHVENTAWAAYNAVTEFVTHQRSSNSDVRTASVWFGRDATFLDTAKKLVLAS